MLRLLEHAVVVIGTAAAPIAPPPSMPRRISICARVVHSRPRGQQPSLLRRRRICPRRPRRHTGTKVRGHRTLKSLHCAYRAGALCEGRHVSTEPRHQRSAAIRFVPSLKLRGSDKHAAHTSLLGLLSRRPITWPSRSDSHPLIPVVANDRRAAV